MEEMVGTDHTGINVEDLHHHDNFRFNNITMLSLKYLISKSIYLSRASDKEKEIYWEFAI